MLGITGSPLPGEGFDWATAELGDQVLVNSISGGTDICSAFVGGNRWLPAYRGELSGPCLGVDVTAYDPAGNEIVGEVGELVVRRPMPSMPVGFWNDPGGERYRSSYFDVYPGVWRHGDWVTMSPHRSFVISGRSDATLNRGGVRLGTAEFYAVVEELPEITDSLVVHLEDRAGRARARCCCSSRRLPGPPSTTSCATGSAPRCAASCPPDTCPTRSSRSRRYRAR